MLIRYWMSKPVITVEKNDSMQQAATLMKENRIRLLPVIDKGKLCGILSDRDLKRASASDATSLDVHELLYLVSKIKVADIMTRDVVTVNQDWTMEEAADLMLDRKISGAPVVDDKRQLCGVITQTDMFKATLYITGLKKRGFHLAFVLEDTPGSIMEIVNVVREFGGRMASILSTYERAPVGYRNVYLRFYDVSRDRIDKMLKILKGKAKLRYMVDHRENRRILFDNH
ncbi:CBS and ACT domain-containing protein [Desulfosarcina sp.]|uniref:CBS and ACT domain-containing protein n=1 Tax=Desulfosarcina sp. TaxID=2027861 RepID=UPI0029B6768C|nr:CBS and ACT domain-containing protein [Desulfosarcina sp.]MDX2452014.1 CBS and ACT domain-containing protein [Desulfosarcina sp.]MDX2489798.1 CBS and ACT domain-containing protein [Desulfosarcina sp.]